ncbi:unnamed protein product [Effrenium voratum]|nr:unnamed protein product [Effrenium voratum]
MRRVVLGWLLLALGRQPCFSASRPCELREKSFVRKQRSLQVARHGGDPTQGDYTEDLNRRTLAVGVVFLLINIYAFSPWVSSEVRNLKVCVFDKEYEQEFLADAKRNTQGLSSLQDPDCLPLLQVVQRWLPS